jgi:hypothetical protein
MKNRLRFVLLFLMVTLGISIVFRGWIFRSLVYYQPVANRPEYPVTEEKLKVMLNSVTEHSKIKEIGDVIRLSQQQTGKLLQFNFSAVENDPNKIILTGKANCIGYAALFSRISNSIITQSALGEEWRASAHIGHLYCMGVNIHQYTQHPYFVDHDFVILQNKKTGELIGVDPSLYDYTLIRTVRISK